jgi:hypothetical protein
MTRDRTVRTVRAVYTVEGIEIRARPAKFTSISFRNNFYSYGTAQVAGAPTIIYYIDEKVILPCSLYLHLAATPSGPPPPTPSLLERLLARYLPYYYGHAAVPISGTASWLAFYWG